MKSTSPQHFRIKDSRIKREFILAHLVIILLSICLITMTAFLSLGIPMGTQGSEVLSTILIVLLVVVIVISAAIIARILTLKHK